MFAKKIFHKFLFTQRRTVLLYTDDDDDDDDGDDDTSLRLRFRDISNFEMNCLSELQSSL
jgi:hypothetical protein